MLAATMMAAVLLAAASEREPGADDDPYAPGVAASVGAGVGIIHRHGAPLSGVFLDSFPGASPAGEARLGLDGVPRRRRTLAVGGELRLRASTLGPLHVRAPNPIPRTAAARTMSGSATIGLTAWPRALGHRLGLGAEAGYAAAPFSIRDELGLPSWYAVHGPIARARLHAWGWDGRVQLLGRPALGVAFPHALEQAAMTRPGPSVGIALDLLVQVGGRLYLYGHAQLWYAFLARGIDRRFDDHGVPIIAGLLFRTRK